MAELFGGKYSPRGSQPVTGKATLECLCGRVLGSAAEGDAVLFTPGGSFVTPNLQRQLDYMEAELARGNPPLPPRPQAEG